MSADFSPALLLILAATVFPFVLGVLLAVRSRRRVGTTPHCRKCDYVLVGNTSDVCPECGSRLSQEAVVIGDRVRHGRTFAVGLSLAVLGLLLAALLVSGPVRSYDYYRLRPTGWVIDDAKNAQNVTDARRAWAELQRRRDLKRLTATHEAALTTFALDRQSAARQPNPPARHPIFQDWMNYLGDRCVDGALSAEQVKQFCETGIEPRIRVRRLVVAGDTIPVEYTADGLGPKKPGLWCRVSNGPTSIAGKEQPHSAGGGGNSSGFDLGGTSTHYFPGVRAGDHPVVTSCTVEVFAGPFGDDQASRPVHRWTRPLSQTLRVVDVAPPGYVELIDKPELLPAVRAAVAVRRLEVRRADTPDAFADMSIDIKNPPENIAFDILVRSNGKEYEAGNFYVLRGKQTTWGLGTAKLKDLPAGNVDVVFRSSEPVARRTIDLFRIWKGEFVIPNVPLVRTPAPPK